MSYTMSYTVSLTISYAASNAESFAVSYTVSYAGSSYTISYAVSCTTISYTVFIPLNAQLSDEVVKTLRTCIVANVPRWSEVQIVDCARCVHFVGNIRGKEGCLLKVQNHPHPDIIAKFALYHR